MLTIAGVCLVMACVAAFLYLKMVNDATAPGPPGYEDVTFESIDANNDGKLSAEELKSRLIERGVEKRDADELCLKLMAALDTDHDGHISREEWKNMWACTTMAVLQALSSRAPSRNNPSSGESEGPTLSAPTSSAMAAADGGRAVSPSRAFDVVFDL